MERKLASIRKISSVRPIEGADNIEVIMIDGWQLVTQKSNNFKPGDLVVYFEVDSFLPVTEQFEFLRKSSYRNTENLGEGFRIKTIKLRGQVSQGLALPISEFATYNNQDCNWYLPNSVDYVYEGYDLTEYLKVKKYEAPIPAQLAGKIRGNFPSFIPKTDSERVQNLVKDIMRSYMDEMFQVTVKLDGSSMTVYYNQDNFGVCSRNLDLLEDETNSFWRVAKEKKLQENFQYLPMFSLKNIAIQGELMGPGVQKNKEKLEKLDFYVFNIYDIDLGVYLSPIETYELADQMSLLHVPVIHKSITLNTLLNNPTTPQEFIERIVELSKGTMMNGEGKREGLVFKHCNTDFNFKVINPEFLLKYDE